jgi:hypothetical protein
MDLKTGDRVKHPALPAWGIGQVLGTPVDKMVRIFFVGAGEKTISLDHVSLIRVNGAAAAHPLLDNLRHSESAITLRYRSLPESIAYFLGNYPGGFYGQKFVDQERSYKVAAHELCCEVLAKSKLTHLISTGNYDAATREALRVVNATNLIFPNEKMSLRDGLAESAARACFSETLHNLLYGTGLLEERFLGFSRVLETIGAATWTTATYFLFIHDPTTFVFLKPMVTRNAAEICAFEINYKSELNWRTFDQVQEFARYLRREISELRPRDMIDVQSFMWCIAPE